MSDKESEKKNRKPLYIGLAVALLLGFLWLKSDHGEHENVGATAFWIGQPVGTGHRVQSAWDPQWQSHFGGVDDPNHRQNNGYWPAKFKPSQNSFYAALPYDEFDAQGKRKASAKKIPWYDAKHPPAAGESILKNHWLRVVFAGRAVYVQWEDVGPQGTDDFDYVFGDAAPVKNHFGICLSPAALAYLTAGDGDQVSWKFVDDKDVPAGPWRRIVTK